MGNDPVSGVDPTGGCTDSNGNPIPCPEGIPEAGNEDLRVLGEVTITPMLTEMSELMDLHADLARENYRQAAGSFFMGYPDFVTQQGYASGFDTFWKFNWARYGLPAHPSALGIAEPDYTLESLAIPFLRFSKSASVAKSGYSNAFSHGYKYAARIRARALQDPVAHNFPYSFDDFILKAKPILQQDGSLLYREAGFLNGKAGFYELGLNPNTNTIFHRTFVGSK